MGRYRARHELEAVVYRHRQHLPVSAEGGIPAFPSGHIGEVLILALSERLAYHDVLAIRLHGDVGVAASPCPRLESNDPFGLTASAWASAAPVGKDVARRVPDGSRRIQWRRCGHPPGWPPRPPWPPRSTVLAEPKPRQPHDDDAAVSLNRDVPGVVAVAGEVDRQPPIPVERGVQTSRGREPGDEPVFTTSAPRRDDRPVGPKLEGLYLFSAHPEVPALLSERGVESAGRCLERVEGRHHDQEGSHQGSPTEAKMRRQSGGGFSGVPCQGLHDPGFSIRGSVLMSLGGARGGLEELERVQRYLSSPPSRGCPPSRTTRPCACKPRAGSNRSGWALGTFAEPSRMRECRSPKRSSMS